MIKPASVELKASGSAEDKSGKNCGEKRKINAPEALDRLKDFPSD
jgi:hypothetical protein